MKVYKRYECANYIYPDDMKCILTYLNEHGEILVAPSIIEWLYFRFSEEQYCASWVCVVNDQVLEEFENYLTNVNI